MDEPDRGLGASSATSSGGRMQPNVAGGTSSATAGTSSGRHAAPRGSQPGGRGRQAGSIGRQRPPSTGITRVGLQSTQEGHFVGSNVSRLRWTASVLGGAFPEHIDIHPSVLRNASTTGAE
jgi:hypothetical protein